jgi:uncharacterized protein Yka (UPF0111/DUF47 family)
MALTVEEKVRLTIGSLVVENIALNSKVEELMQKVKELEQSADLVRRAPHDGDQVQESYQHEHDAKGD